METSNNSTVQPSASCPHIGKLLADYFEGISLNRAKLSRQLKLADSSVLRYLERDSMQLKTLWNISIALNHNFIAGLGEKLSVNYVTFRETELQNKVEELQKELEKLNIELSVYKNIVGK